MNLILERTNQVPYFTEMGSVFDAVKVSARDYDWHLSDLKINYNVPGFITDDQWITGESLHHLITEQKLTILVGLGAETAANFSQVYPDAKPLKPSPAAPGDAAR